MGSVTRQRWPASSCPSLLSRCHPAPDASSCPSIILSQMPPARARNAGCAACASIARSPAYVPAPKGSEEGVRRPGRRKLAHAFLWEYSDERLKLGQLLGQLWANLASFSKDQHMCRSLENQAGCARGIIMAQHCHNYHVPLAGPGVLGFGACVLSRIVA